MTGAAAKRSPFRNWWNLYRPDEGASRADFARLRRCASPTEALLEPAAYDLVCRIAGDDARRDWRAMQAATAAAVLAHVREDDPGMPFATRLGQSSDRTGGQQPVMSPLRFARLIDAAPGQEQLDAFRRAVQLARRQANVEDIGQALLWWNERTRIDWTFHYHGAGFAAPRSTETTETKETMA